MWTREREGNLAWVWRKRWKETEMLRLIGRGREAGRERCTCAAMEKQRDEYGGQAG
jgi:hypothetical protein